MASLLCRHVASRAFTGNPAPNLVEVTELPEEDQQLLMEMDLLGGTRQVSLDQGVIQQLSQALQDEAQVLTNEEVTHTHTHRISIKHPTVRS